MNLEVLLNKVQSYNHNVLDLLQIKKAYEYAEKCHAGQKRNNGEDYIIHPLAVALILSELEADTDTLIAALLHDVIEDSDVTKEDIDHDFNPFVAKLVDGVTKINKFEFSTKEDEKATNTRKLINSFSEEVRIILIKLADRLHNMRTLEFKEPNKQLETAFETRDIYAPIAYRLGWYRMKAELEDSSFKYINPEQYYLLEKQVNKITNEANEDLLMMFDKLYEWLNANDIPNNIKYRIKNIYRVYKSTLEGAKLSDMHDLLALIIMVNDIKDCYPTLGLVHECYRTTNSDFRDYLYQPKINDYRSIHTTVFGEGERLVQIRIRTHDLDKIASFGVAANWQKDGVNMNQSFKKSQLFSSLDSLKLSTDNSEYLAALKLELDSMYVFTPKGKLISLPMDANAIDFAYKIHTEIGNGIIGAVINGEFCPPETVLKHKDIVKIITGDVTPNKEWANQCKTNLAKKKILAR